ncbi:MAG: type II toxin-antitoxin system VapC family toxin [Armatimonadetes bacterium]|nr:type II toxin-antitoxin system VapC family toxin [Armatimonadota bacterium]
MRVLLDTNILLRHVNRADPQHEVVRLAVRHLTANGWDLCIAPQSIFEFWVVATRPPDVNGLGLDPSRTRQEVEVLLDTFGLLQDPDDLVQRWLSLCATHAVCGRAAHDARLVTVMLAHGIGCLLTLNPGDFRRYAEVTCLEPAEVGAG